VVVLTEAAVAYVTGPATVAAVTGREVTAGELGGVAAHAGRSGVASLVAADEDDALGLAAEVLSFLPPNVAEVPPVWPPTDPGERACDAAVPASPNEPYDVRSVLAAVVDHGDLLELRPGYAPAVVTALARVDGRPVGVVANQPLHLAGTLDIEASRKAARFVR